MDVAAALVATGAHRSEASFSLFAQSLDPRWIKQALQATGTATMRRRKASRVCGVARHRHGHAA